MSSPHYRPSEETKSKVLESVKARSFPYFIKAPALDVTWGGDNRYWRIPSESESQSNPDRVIELVQVSWLEVTGSLNLNKYFEGGQTYKLIFMLSLKDDAFGWADSPVYFMAKPGKGPYVWKKFDLSKITEPQVNFTVPSILERKDELQFGMYEIWRGRWKGGLTIKGVQIIKPAAGD